MIKAVFVVSKPPFGAIQDGETAVSRLLIEAAVQTCSVNVVALAEGPTAHGRAPVKVVEVPKQGLSLPRLALPSLLRRRSLIHSRFSPAPLRRALERTTADVFVARRVYMAQGMVDAGQVPPRTRLVVLVDVLESMVMRLRRSPLRPLLAVEARRTRRDELRCVRAASEVAYFSEVESSELGDVARGRRRLDLVQRPAARAARLTDPIALFVGDRRWRPNAEALSRLLAIWPTVARSVPEARLRIIGHPGPRERLPAAANVEVAGFVDDLDAAWQSAAVLLAPVSIGGGVRVKVLDAARHGVPVVGTTAAIGSAERYLPLASRAGDDDFIADAAVLLGDRTERRRRGGELYEANRELNEQGFVEEQIAALLTGNRP